RGSALRVLRVASAMTNVLVLSGTASAINYINSFAGDAAIRLHVTDSDPYCPGLYAPGVTAHHLPRARDTDVYRIALDRIIADHAIDVLIPTSDYDVGAIVDYLHDGWTSPVALFRPTWEAHRCLADKQRLTAHLASVRARMVPRSWNASKVDELADGLPYPVVLKPVAESGGKGVSIVCTSADLRSAIARLRRAYGEQFLVQKYIPGRTYVVSLVFDHA